MTVVLLTAAVAHGESDTTVPPEPAVQPGKIEPPRFKDRSAILAAKISKCYSLFARRTSQMGRVVVRVSIAPDGNPTVVSVPPGTVDWQEETARCAVRTMSFEPGTRDGVPVAAEVDVPINFSIEGTADVTYLRVATSDEELERALRHCYPADEISMATPKFRVDVDSRGRTVDFELVESSGVATLDEAGACMLESISFQPTKQGERPVSSTAIVPITVRPPKQAIPRAQQSRD